MGQNFLKQENVENIGLALNISGGIYSASQAVQEGQAEQAYYNTLAQITERQASNVQQAASRDIAALNKEGKVFKASQTAASVASGMTGQALEDLLMDTTTKIKLDELAIKQNASSQVIDLQNQALFSRVSGKYAARAGRAKGYATLLGTAGQVADYWYKRKQLGFD
jgi:hypothetical protein